MNKGTYVLYRLGAMIPTLIGVIVLIFFLTQSIKGDPARMMAGDAADAQVLETAAARVPVGSADCRSGWPRTSATCSTGTSGSPTQPSGPSSKA